MIQDHYLAIKLWIPKFNSCEDSFGCTMVWICFIGLNVMFYDESAMKTIALAMGHPNKVDITPKMTEGGKFAEICVEVDFSALVM